MIFIKILLPLLSLGLLYLIFQWATRAWKKADVEQKIEDIGIQDELYKKTVTIDPQEVKAVKKHVDKIKNIKT